MSLRRKRKHQALRRGRLCAGRSQLGGTTMKHFNWDAIPAERLNDKFVRKLAWDGDIMVGRTDVEQGYVVPPHSHDNQQITWVMSGKWRFTLEGKTIDVGP